MSNNAFDVPPPPLYPDMPEPPPRYEESMRHSKQGTEKGQRQINVGQDESQQASIIMVSNGSQQQHPGFGRGATLVVEPIFGKHAMPYICPNCLETIMTRTEPKAGKITYLICCLMCCFISPLLAWIPCCVNQCRDVEHRCPSCDALIGTFKRM